MKNFIKKTAFILTGLLLPAVSFAQSAPVAAPAVAGGGTGRGRTATQLLDQVTEVVELMIPILIGLALLVFLWGVFKYVFASDPKNKKEALPYITWGIISLFIMVSIWGIVFLLQGAFLGNTDPSQPPQQEVDQLQQLPDSEGSGLAGGTPILNLIKEIGDIVADVIPLLILIALVVFLWGVFKYAFSTDAKSKQDARNFMVWGIVALTVMVSVWVIVIILQRTVFSNSNPAELGSSGEAVTEMTQDPKVELGTQNSGGEGINAAIIKVIDVVQVAIPVLITIGTLLFIWGVFKYVSTDNAKKKSEAVAYIGWGVILLLTMAAVWGFVKLIGDSTGVRIDSQQKPTSGAKVPLQDLIKR